jgi:hypothetical protein
VVKQVGLTVSGVVDQVAPKAKQPSLAAIIGIVAACIVGVVAVVVAACCARRCRNKRRLARTEASNLPRALPCEPVEHHDLAVVMTPEPDCDKPRALPAIKDSSQRSSARGASMVSRSGGR